MSAFAGGRVQALRDMEATWNGSDMERRRGQGKGPGTEAIWNVSDLERKRAGICERRAGPRSKLGRLHHRFGDPAAGGCGRRLPLEGGVPGVPRATDALRYGIL